MTHREVTCVRCGDGYSRHEDRGGACRARDGGGRCPCLGFRWIDPEPPPLEPRRFRS